ncbi:MAG: stage II sporulation protein P, partial [Oscillospiraceae bacterium]|nr:stage II sporulation protein P [Oscillospiraceae bacterium]
MRKRRKNGLLFLALMFVVAATGIRLLSASGAEKFIKEKIFKLSSNEEFMRYAMSHGTQLVESEGDKKLLRALVSELPSSEDFVESTEEKAEEVVNVPADEKREELTVWEYTPGGEKKENTYPIENTTISPKSEKVYVHHGNIWVKNDSTKGIDLKWLLSAKLPFKLTGDGPHVLIVHTHGSESYLPQGRDTYTLTDVERTSDKRYNVIRVGDEL